MTTTIYESTDDMRAILIGVLHRLLEGKTPPQQALAAAALARQYNRSVSLDMEARKAFSAILGGVSMKTIALPRG